MNWKLFRDKKNWADFIDSRHIRENLANIILAPHVIAGVQEDGTQSIIVVQGGRMVRAYEVERHFDLAVRELEKHGCRTKAIIQAFKDMALQAVSPYRDSKKLMRLFMTTAILTSGAHGIRFGSHVALQNKVDETRKNGIPIQSINNELLYPKLFGIIPIPLKTIVSRPLLNDGTVDVRLVIPDPVAEASGHTLTLSSMLVTPNPPTKPIKSRLYDYGA